MSLEIDATYENGVLKLDKPLPLHEKQRVKVTIEEFEKPGLTFGLIGWVGDPDVVRRIALDPEFGIQESP